MTASWSDALAFALFASSAAWIIYLYIGYPAALALLSGVRRVKVQSSDEYLPSVSVLIAARNEEQDIGWKLLQTLEWDYPAEKLDVLVGSDASSDRTDGIVRGFDPSRVQLIRTDQRGGKGRMLNRLVDSAHGELLFFTDANSHIAATCLRKVVRHFADSRVGCVTGDSYPVSGDETAAIADGTNAYLRYETVLKYLEGRLGSVLVCDGAIFCIRRSLYTPVLPELANDLELPLRIAHAGFWNLHEPAAQVIEKDTSSVGEEFRRRRRICAQGALGAWKLRHTLHGFRGWQFVSHKVLRWLILLPMVVLLVSSAQLATNPLFAALFAAQAAFYLAALASVLLLTANRDPGRLLAIPLYVVVGSVGAFIGVVDAFTGRRFDVWESPGLSRGHAQGART